MNKKIRVVELFAGVGGFHLGLNRATEGNTRGEYEVVWSSQWEPGAKRQTASEIYRQRFGVSVGKEHSNEDIQKVIENNFDAIPDHDLLVGGFPCQDYSVARTLNQAHGLAGKKGVLWWSIYNILAKKGEKAPNYLMLENVDRLLNSPSKQRGRDFAIMLSSLVSLGYVVEWRILNAADYGFPQRRRRIFILGYRRGTTLDARVREDNRSYAKWLTAEGLLAATFPVGEVKTAISTFVLDADPAKVSEEFSRNMPKTSPFGNAGIVVDGVVRTLNVKPRYNGQSVVLKDVLVEESDVPESFFIAEKDVGRWEYLKGAKKETRTSKDGYKYAYSEGGMVFPDNINGPSRTIVTGEGGASPSRFKHVVRTPSGRLRRLMPIELERLNMFPDNHTAGTTDIMRAFLMGNALVVGIVERLGKALADEILGVVRQNIEFKYDISEQLILKLAENLVCLNQEKGVFQGTYRRDCRKWILENNLYNLPLTEKLTRKELSAIRYLLLTSGNAKSLYFKVQGSETVLINDLKKSGYPVSRKPHAQKYVLFKLSVTDETPPVHEPLKRVERSGKMLG